MSLKDITITGSIGSIATQSYGQKTYISSTDEQSFPIEHITGSDAKTWPDFVQGTNYTIGLVVNVTQSWSSSNITPLGDIPFVHDTMEEFVNGEFSGSNYVVTDGNLNDEDCERLLVANTIPTRYSIFLYYGNYQKFIKTDTSPNQGQMLILETNYGENNIYYTNVHYLFVKIARIDLDGNNNTLSLQDLTNIIWKDSNTNLGSGGKINLKIDSITEYPTYYLYKIQPFSTGTPFSDALTNTNRLNYQFSASSNIPEATTSLTYINNWTVIKNSYGNFDGIEYNFDLSPNIPIKYTASITVTNYNASNVYFDFGFWENTYEEGNTYFTPIKVISNITMSTGATNTFILKGVGYWFDTFQGSPNTRYHLELANLTAPVSLSNTFWILTSSLPPRNNTSSLNIEPFISTSFINSDCDVLMNNASQNDISEFYRRVLYDNGGYIPSNFQQIINGTAELAQVNDYLFNINANVLPRYKGSRVQQQFLNKWTEGDIGPSLTPSVQSLKTSVAYSTTVVDQAPIRMNTSKIFVKYYIDEAGNIITPNVDENSLYIAQGNFPTNENLDVNYSIQGNTNAPQYRPIIRGGARLEPIIYNQIRDYTNPPMLWSPSMSFTDNNPLSSATIGDYTVTLKSGVITSTPNNNYLTHNSPPSGIGMTQVVQKGKDITSEISTISTYTITNNVLAERLSLKFEVNLQISNYNAWPVLVGGSIIKGGASPLNRYYYEAPRITISRFSTVTYRFFATAPFSSLQLGDIFSVGLFTDDGTSDPNYFGRVVYSPNSTFKISTTPLPTAPISTSGLFQLASSLPNYIYTTSSQLLSFYNNNETRQVDIEGSTFSPVTLPFTLKIGDEFRFDGDESKVFMVKDFATYESNSGSLLLNSASLYIELDKQISGSNVENINHFLLRRYVDDAESIIFTNTSDKRITGSLVISPEHKSTLLDNNINKYIEDLTQKGLI